MALLAASLPVRSARAGETEEKPAEEPSEQKQHEAREKREAEEAEIKAQFSYTFNDVYDKLVLIECKGKHGAWQGSGFVAAMDGKTYIFTNQHIVLGTDTISFKTAKGEVLRPRAVELSATRDIARLLLEDHDALAVSDNLSMGAPLAVFGNSEGSGVATELYGKVTGVGADLVEVSAEFVSGNSGSPVLNQDREVIGIASYVRYSQPSQMKEGTQFENKVRRFCYRLTDVQWMPVNWKKYNEEYGKAYRETEELVDSVFAVVNGWYEDPFGPVSEDQSDYDLRKWSNDHNHMVNRIVRLSDKGRASVSELNSTNKQIRNDIGDSAEALSAFCKKRARFVEFKAEKRDLTGFLRDEFEGYVYRLQYASEAIDYIGTKLAVIDYFHFKGK
jgi:hypothetical protein